MSAKEPSQEQLKNRIRWFQHQATMACYDEKKARVAEFKRRIIPLLEAVDTDESRQEALEERMGLGVYLANKHLAKRTEAMAEEAVGQFDVVSQRCYDRIYKKGDAKPRHFGMFAFARCHMAQIRNRQKKYAEARRLAEEAIELLLSGRWNSLHRNEMLVIGYACVGNALRGSGAMELAALKNYEQALEHCRIYIDSGLALCRGMDDLEKLPWEKDDEDNESWKTQEEEDDCPWLAMSFDVEGLLKPVRRHIVGMVDSEVESTRQFAQELLRECDVWLVPNQPEIGQESKEAPPSDDEHQFQVRNRIGQDSKDTPD